MIPFETSGAALDEAPLPPSWVIDGAPLARAARLMRSADGAMTLWVWSCTPGLFRWHYVVELTCTREETLMTTAHMIYAPTAGRRGILRTLPTIEPEPYSAEPDPWDLEPYRRMVAETDETSNG